LKTPEISPTSKFERVAAATVTRYIYDLLRAS
jgi:hypothetical protein